MNVATVMCSLCFYVDLGGGENDRGELLFVETTSGELVVSGCLGQGKGEKKKREL